jgi:hypothetical protein
LTQSSDGNGYDRSGKRASVFDIVPISVSVSVVTRAASLTRHSQPPDEHVVRQEHDAERNLFFNQTGAHNG